MSRWLAVVAVLVGLVFVEANAAVLKIEAEAANTLGANWTNGTDGAIQFISTSTNGMGNNPGFAARVATFNVTFPEAGVYDLYVRVRVGTGAASDDSLFYANGFGSKSPGVDADWILCNNLNAVGYTTASDVVSGGGSAGNQVWKWLNVSEFDGGGEAPIVFNVPAGALTQTFSIASREDGLRIDALAFGTAIYLFTVANLDGGADGTPVPDGNGACAVNWNDVRQVIDGFGASSAWRGQWSAALANMFFSTNSGTGVARNGTPYSYTGVGLSLLRTRIAPGGTTVEQTIMQMAQSRGARVWSAPWSPAPAAQFKSNGDVNGGSFIGNVANYQAYANQMAGYVANMKNQYGVNLYALSVQNEPDANVTTYESCNWTAQQIHDFIPYLSSALAASNVGTTKIILPESQNWTDPQGLRLTTLNDAAVAPLVSIVANHNYVPNNAVGDQTTPAAINAFGKSLWQTEVAKLSGDDGSINDALYWAGRVHLFLTAAQANAWHYWWLCAYGTSNEGLCDTNDAPAKRMYTLGNFSRFVRPGYHRVNVTNTAGPLRVSAYKNLTNANFAIVAINSTGTNITQTFNLNGFAAATVTPWLTSASASLAPQSPVVVNGGVFTSTIPALSVVTLVGQSTDNSPPVLMAVSNRTIDAGIVLTVTNIATDADLPPQVLAFSSLSAPSNSTLNATSGVVTWRPLVSQAGTTNPFSIRVTDNGTPSLSATNNFLVTVNPLVLPAFNAMTTSGGQLTLTATGMLGPDYLLLTSTNLSNWELLWTSNSPAIPVTFNLTNTSEMQRFYRLQLGP